MEPAGHYLPGGYFSSPGGVCVCVCVVERGGGVGGARWHSRVEPRISNVTFFLRGLDPFHLRARVHVSPTRAGFPTRCGNKCQIMHCQFPSSLHTPSNLRLNMAVSAVLIVFFLPFSSQFYVCVPLPFTPLASSFSTLGSGAGR